MNEGLRSRAFRIEHPDPLRVLRGSIDHPAGMETSRERAPDVLILHGFKGFMDWGFFPELARRLARRGLAAVRFNFAGSGVGEQPEVMDADEAFFANTPSREVDDVEHVRTFLDAGSIEWIDPRRGGIFGHSLGAAIALLHAARRRDYRALVGWAPVSHFQRFGAEVERDWRSRGFVEIPNLRTGQIHRLGRGWLEDLERQRAALDVRAACSALATPTLFVHGTADEAVPLEESEVLTSAFAEGLAERCIVPGANHTFGAVHPFRGSTSALETAFEATITAFDRHLCGG